MKAKINGFEIEGSVEEIRMLIENKPNIDRLRNKFTGEIEKNVVEAVNYANTHDVSFRKAYTKLFPNLLIGGQHYDLARKLGWKKVKA